MDANVGFNLSVAQPGVEALALEKIGDDVADAVLDAHVEDGDDVGVGELGGGPLAMAFAEGARVVVAGCYDPTAPLMAAALKCYEKFGFSVVKRSEFEIILQKKLR